MLKSTLIASNELINKQPDIFNDKSLYLIIQILNAKNLGDEFILLALQHLKYAALLHEFNRQNIMNAGIVTSLKPLLKTNNTEVSRAKSIGVSCEFVFYGRTNSTDLFSFAGAERDMFIVPTFDP